MKLSEILDAILDIVYPQFCIGCGQFVEGHEQNICWSCMADLEQTENYKYDKNPITELFDGIVPIWKGASYYAFKKGGVLQKMIHQLKYRNDKEVGEWIGERMAEDLATWLENFDMMLPIPIHEKKKQLRGYNQVQIIGDAIAKFSTIEMNSSSLMKVVHNESQTKKTKEQRIANVNGVFDLKDLEVLEGKNILILDDLVTTGSTTISAIQTVLEKASVKSISVLYVASQPFL